MSDKDNAIHSVEKAFILLDCFLDSNQPLSLQELTNLTGWPKSTVHNLLSSMRKQLIIMQDESNGKYYMGIHMLELGNAVRRSLNIRIIAEPYMKEIANSIGESIHLTAIRGDKLVLLKIAEPSTNPLKVVLNIGTSIPFHSTSHGKVFLAAMTKSSAIAILNKYGQCAYTPHTITTQEELLSQLEEIKAQGFAIDNGERHVGLHSVAAPIFDSKRNVSYCLGAVGMFNRPNTDKFIKAKALIIEAAKAISGELGYREEKVKKLG